jgi:uncharacterized protein YjiS (DUF1127 family)
MHRIMRAERAPASSFGSRSASLLRHILTWWERTRQRQALATVDDWLLKDMGVSRSDAMREYDKPFWQQ